VKADLQIDGLPANIDAEKTILGAILLDNSAHAECAEKLTADDFFLDSHRRIFLRMTELMNEQRAVDIVTLANELSKNKEVESIGGVAYLASLTEGLPRRPVIEEYIRIVKDKSMLRRLMIFSSQAMSRAADQEMPALELAGRMIKQIEKLVEPSMQSGSALASTFIVETLADIDREYQTGTSPCIPSGNAWFDAKTGGGYRQSNITLICARPNVGKTPFAVMSIAHNLKLGRKCVLFSLEKKKESILRDLIPYFVNVPNRVVNNAWMQTPEQNRLIHDGFEALAGYSNLLSIYDQKMDREQICWAIKRESKGGQEVLFEIDHFGMIKGSGRGEDPVERDNLTSASIRDTIKDTKSAVVVLRQLRKVAREFADKAPTPDDVKGSSNAWEDAFAALIIHREIDGETKRMSRVTKLNLAKLRTGGSTGSADGNFNVQNLCFETEAELEYEGNDYYA
jgi:replicative DNA helicase